MGLFSQCFLQRLRPRPRPRPRLRPKPSLRYSARYRKQSRLHRSQSAPGVPPEWADKQLVEAVLNLSRLAEFADENPSRSVAEQVMGAIG